jgi:hypothetical protein
MFDSIVVLSLLDSKLCKKKKEKEKEKEKLLLVI